MSLEISYSEMRKSLKSYLDQVCSEHKPLLVKRRKGENVMLLSEDRLVCLPVIILFVAKP